MDTSSFLDVSKLIDQWVGVVKGAGMNEKRIGCCGDGSDTARASFPPDLARQADLFKALGDEVRLKVLHLVRDQEVCVCDLVPRLGVVQSTLSHHLKVLQDAGLVTARKQGRWNYYRATPAALMPLQVFGSSPDVANPVTV